MAVKPRKPAPSLEVDLVGGGRWSLAAQKPESFSMLVFYRGLHCPVCRRYTTELNGAIGEFEKRGVSTLILSTDPKDRAERAKAEWGLANLAVGYGVPIDKAREWGLFISTSRGTTSAGIEEPPLFNEPGLFLVKPDGTLYAALIGSAPWARPQFKDVLAAIDFVKERNYPARGEA